MLGTEGRRPPATNIPTRNGGFSLDFSREVVSPSPHELLQVRERVRGGQLPLFVIKDDEKNRGIAGMWKIPGTSVRVSPEGDIYYPVWRERSRVNKSELYYPCSKLPQGWTFERLLASKRRPISEVVYYSVSADDGSVEAAIRNMDHILEGYLERGKELEQAKEVKAQISQAMRVLRETVGVPEEKFERGFTDLYGQTLRIMERSGMAKAASALKRDIARLLSEASAGRDRIGRRNPIGLLKKLEAAIVRVEYRLNEVGFVIVKFETNKKGLIAQREKDRGILEEARHDLSIGFASHEAFHSQRETTGMQKGILKGKIGTLIYKLRQVKVKAYKPVVKEVGGELQEARERVDRGDYSGASEIFEKALEKVSQILDRFTEIERSPNSQPEVT